MLPHDNYIMHFNKNHDPRNGQFTKGHGGSVSKSNAKNQNVKRKTSKESTNEQTNEDKSTNVSELSDKELIKKIERAKLEKEYKTLTGDTLNKQGSNYLKNFIPQMTDKVLFPLLDTGIKIAVETLLHDNYMPNDNYIMHFNKNHDPRNGQFTKGSGGSISSTSSKKSNSSKKSDSNSSKLVDKKKAEEYIKKHPDQAKYITIGDDGHMRFDVMRWQIDEDLKQASNRLIRKKTNTTTATTRKENTTATTRTENNSEIRKKALVQTGKKVGQIIGGIALAGLIGRVFGVGRGHILSQGDAERLGHSLIREIARRR